MKPQALNSMHQVKAENSSRRPHALSDMTRSTDPKTGDERIDFDRRDPLGALPFRLAEREKLWTDMGVDAWKRENCVQVEFGNGLFRIDRGELGSWVGGFANRGVQLDITRSHKVSKWQYHPLALLSKIRRETKGIKLEELPIHDFRLKFAGRRLTVGVSQSAPTQTGYQISVLRFGPKQRFVFPSDFEIKPFKLRFIAMTLFKDPIPLYGHFRNRKLFLVTELGQTQLDGEKPNPIRGWFLQRTGRHIVLSSPALASQEDTDDTLRHEVGHYIMNPVVDTIQDSHGNLLFGSGKFSLDDNGQFDRRKSDFVNPEAYSEEERQTNHPYREQLLRFEDGAATLQELLRFREWMYLHYGRELFLQHGRQIDAHFEFNGFTSLGIKKFHAVDDRLRQLFPYFPFATQEKSQLTQLMQMLFN